MIHAAWLNLPPDQQGKLFKYADQREWQAATDAMRNDPLFAADAAAGACCYVCVTALECVFFFVAVVI